MNKTPAEVVPSLFSLLVNEPFGDTTLGNIICAEISAGRLREHVERVQAKFLAALSAPQGEVVAAREEGPTVGAIEQAARYGWEHPNWTWEAVKGGLDRFATPARQAAEGGEADEIAAADRAVSALKFDSDKQRANAVAMFRQGWRCAKASASPPPSAAEGMVVVPVEATPEMIAADLALDIDATPADSWRAMLAARPSGGGEVGNG